MWDLYKDNKEILWQTKEEASYKPRIWAWEDC